jgi:hypothetical protein
MMHNDPNVQYLTFVAEAREIATKYLQPQELREDAGYMADAVAATEIWVQLSVIAKAYMDPTRANTRASLLYILCGGMSDNLFWRKANALVSPVFANALLKMNEAHTMDADFPNKNQQAEGLIAVNKVAILDVYSVILYALGGYPLATNHGVNAKKEMHKLLFG